MTASEQFVSRWARLKRNADNRRSTEFAGDSLPRPAADLSSGGAEIIGKPPIDAAADAPYDPASLPSIEAISVNTDIRGFLQSHVPAELTRAALRQAWANDPAIRNFVGIAENQWDFNDPNAIPGFGPLLESDNVANLLAQALREHQKLAGRIPEMPVSAEQSWPAEVPRHEPVPLNGGAQQGFDGSLPTDNFSGSPDASCERDQAAASDHVAEEDEFPRRRSHGSALPQ
jgi:Protein of unknown function (DUF3306)